MKIIYSFILLTCYISANCQSVRQRHKTANHTKTYKSNVSRKALNNQLYDTTQPVQPRETATERYLNGTLLRRVKADTTKQSGNNSPFAGGVHAAANAGEKFDSAGNINPNSVHTNAGTNTASNTNGAPANDTVFNNNTITDNGVTTNSGAVDRSGRAQFGQTNWGNSRSTVGESQWTIPPPVTASFSRDVTNAGNLTWTRNTADTSVYSARYKSGDRWVTSNYSISGQRLDMRTEVPLTLLPPPVNTYISKMPATLAVVTITRWQVLGKADVYEIQTKTGKTIYVNEDGTEVNR